MRAPCISAPTTMASIRWMADLNTRTLPRRPFMLFGQMTTADPSRSPAGTESAWAYTHLPRGLADDESAERLSEAVDLVLEEHAPGFADHVIGKAIHDRPIWKPATRSARRRRQWRHLRCVSS